MKAKKIGFIFQSEGNLDWWKSHTMAPAPILYNETTIRIYIGCWSAKKISRIGFIDVDIDNPNKIKKISKNYILEIGREGCFDENGVFPAHAFNFKNGKVFLYYTGFQLGDKIRHYNFGGLAISNDGGDTFQRYSEAPILDRSDEGLFVRAGQSIELIENSNEFHTVYSAGSSWFECNGKKRPMYDVYYQKSLDGIISKNIGTKIISSNISVEHALGRPQIIKLGEYFYIFFTRRIIDNMNYYFGIVRSKDCKSWERADDIVNNINFGTAEEFDSEMIYFPSVVKVSQNKAWLFYSGNNFGDGGLGLIELNF